MPLPGDTDDWVREWFREVYNQLQQMATGLGLDDLREASYLVDQAYKARYPAQVVRFSVPRGPGERQAMLSLVDSALGQGLDQEGHRVVDVKPVQSSQDPAQDD